MALTQREFDELAARRDSDDTSEEDRREIAIFMLSEASEPQTLPGIRQDARDVPVAAPEGREAELLAAANPDTNRLAGGGVPTTEPDTRAAQAERTLSRQSVTEGARRRSIAMIDFLLRPLRDEEKQNGIAAERRDENAEATFALLEDASALGIDNAEIFRQVGAGEFVPDIALSMYPALAMRSVMRRIGGEVVAGGVIFGSLAEGDESALGLAAMGAIGSGMLGLVTEIPGIARSVVAGDVARALRQKFGDLKNVPRNPFQPTEASLITGVKQTVGETTANARVLAMESEIQSRAKVGGHAETFVRERSIKAIKQFGKVARSLNPENVSAHTIIKTLDKARASAVRAISAEASEAFRRILSPALKGVGAKLGPRGQIVGGRRFIQTGTLRAELRKIATDARKPVSGDPTRAKWADEQVARLESNADQLLTIGDFQAMTRDLADGAIAESAIVKTKPLQQAMRTDLSVTRQLTSDIEIAKVLDALEDANAAFAVSKGPADEINAIFIEKLGIQEKGLSGEAFAEKFAKLPPSQKMIVFRTIHTFDSNLSRQLSGRTFQQTMERNLVLSKTVEFLDSPLDVLKIASFAEDIARGSAADIRILLNTPGMDESQTKLIAAAFDQLNKLKGTPNAIAHGGPSALGRVREIFINAVSRDAGFMSRLLAGEMTPGALERWLYTEKGLNALLDIGRASLKFGKAGTMVAGITGMETLLDLSTESDEVREALERRVRLERSLARLVQAGP